MPASNYSRGGEWLGPFHGAGAWGRCGRSFCQCPESEADERLVMSGHSAVWGDDASVCNEVLSEVSDLEQEEVLQVSQDPCPGSQLAEWLV